MHTHPRFAQALSKITTSAITNDTPAPILDEIVNLVGETLAADRALIYQVCFDTQQIIGMSEWINPAQHEIAPTKTNYPLDAFRTGATEMQRTRQPFFSHADNINPHLLSDGSAEVLHQQMNIQSLLWFPFAFSDNAFYALTLNQIYKRKEWTADELIFLESVSQLVSVTLSKIQLMEDRGLLQTSLVKASQAIEQMRSSLQRITLAVEQSDNVIVITDADASIEYVNTAFTKTTGYTLAEVKGKNPRLLQSGKTSEATFYELWQHLTGGDSWQGELVNKRKDGEEYINRVRISPVRDAYGKVTHYLGIEEDITEKNEAEERIKYLANFDSLTGLPNRSQLDEHLTLALGMAKRSNGLLSVMIFDLDHFKDINDTLGHSVGDVLLIQLAKRITSLLRAEDTVSRLGGDEFILMLPGTDAHGAAEVAEKILALIAKPFLIGQQQLHVTGSLGIAVYPDDGKDIETLTKNADAAMYRVKKEGRQGFRFFTQDMQKSAARAHQLLNAMRQALTLNQFKLNFQPQLSIETGAVIGAEALLRWNHPELGFVSPGEFIPVAEESGLIVPIGEWVLRSAAQQAKSWLDAGHAPIIMAVNLSAVQFRQPDLPALVTRILDEVGLPPEYLELELTEGVAMNDPKGAIAIMNDLHERGIRMSIDDFGTGYSSLSYLKKFKVYKLKIDQSFVRDISTDAEDKAIVSAVINLARSLGLLTIAEGVETAAQLDFLQQQGCDEVQGYFYSKPLPAEQFEEFLRAKNSRF